MKQTIVKAEIKEKRYQNLVVVYFNDGSSKELFHYYPDEIDFNEDEFIGLTKDEALDLRRRKDIAYLRS